MRVQVTEHGGHAVVSPSGELDTASAQDLAAAIRAGFGSGRPLVVLDLVAVTFIDSTAATALLREHDAAQAEGRRLRLAAVPPPVARVLAMLGVDEVLDLRASVAEAVAG